MLDNGNDLLTDTKPVSAISAAQRQELLKLVEKDCLIPLPRGNKEKIATRQMAILVHGYYSDDQWAEIYLQTQFTSGLKAHERDLDNCRTFLSVPKNPSEGKDTAESLSADIMDVVAQSCNAAMPTLRLILLNVNSYCAVVCHPSSAVPSSLLSSMAHCPRWGLCTTN